ncbi:MAG TPA: hypothetical protein VF590_01025 [Isosphaeraceae bacterium]|jgi:hypothetical protein
MLADPLRSLVIPASLSRAGSGRAEAARYFFRDGIYELIVPARGVAGEVEAVERGAAEFALVDAGPLLLLGHRFGDAIPWSLATHGPPPGPERESPHAPEEDADGARALLHVRLVPPGREDEALARRNVTLSLGFTRALDAALRDRARGPADPAAQRRALQELRRRYPTAEDLVGHASVRTIGSC